MLLSNVAAVPGGVLNSWSVIAVSMASATESLAPVSGSTSTPGFDVRVTLTVLFEKSQATGWGARGAATPRHFVLEAVHGRVKFGEQSA